MVVCQGSSISLFLVRGGEEEDSRFSEVAGGVFGNLNAGEQLLGVCSVSWKG